MTGYVFDCAGTFAGVSSFEEDDEVRHFLGVDYFGGKVSVSIDPATADSLESHKMGEPCRLVGEVLVSGGSFKPVLKRITFKGDKDFEEVSLDEMYNGLVMSGPAHFMRKSSYTSRDGVEIFRVRCMLMGGTVDLQVDPEVFSTLPEGRVIMRGRLFSEISQGFSGGKKTLNRQNWVTVIGARGFDQMRSKR